MASNVDALIDKILDKAEAKVKASLVSISSKITADFRAEAKNAIQSYYANYTPVLYERTGNLRKNVIGDDLSFNVLNGNTYGGGVQFNSGNMPDYTNGGDKDIVVQNFMAGIHPGRRGPVHVEYTPAHQIMEDFQKGYKKTLDGYFISHGFTVH